MNDVAALAICAFLAGMVFCVTCALYLAGNTGSANFCAVMCVGFLTAGTIAMKRLQKRLARA